MVSLLIGETTSGEANMGGGIPSLRFELHYHHDSCLETQHLETRLPVIKKPTSMAKIGKALQGAQDEQDGHDEQSLRNVRGSAFLTTIFQASWTARPVGSYPV